MTNPIKPVGYHFKNNPIKAFYNANFYKPKANEYKKYVSIVNDEAQPNDRLFEQIKPFESVIGNYAKSINKSVEVSLGKLSKGRDSIILSYWTVLKNGDTGCQAGAMGVGKNSSDSKRDGLTAIYEKLVELSKG